MSEIATEREVSPELEELVRSRNGFIFDLDGTLYLGDELIPGAAEAIEHLREMEKRVAFVSNKPIATRQSYAQKLRRLGIPCSVEDVLNSSLVCARYLEKNYPGAKVFPVGEEPLITELKEHGLQISDQPEQVDVVVVSWDRNFNYRKLDIAYRSACNGAELIGTNPDRTCPMPGYDMPDAGCMIAAIEACTERPVDPIVGKPSPIMIREALDLLGLSAEECAMFGDRPETDLMMAHRAGIGFVLVLSGVTDEDDLDSLPAEPECVARNVGAICPVTSP